MKILLATGIFPPEIGGPATYVRSIARELTARGDDVVVITYGPKPDLDRSTGYLVVSVGKHGGPIRRWLRYRDALKLHGAAADYVCAFTSISAGIPILMSGLTKPKKILRLGGDFFWERYTDSGGTMTLREWYAASFGFWRLMNWIIMRKVLCCFDRLVYSTDFQREIHRRAYRKLPPSLVEENARPEGVFVAHAKHTPFRLLFMGRFVRFKNIPALIDAVALLSDVTLTIIGEGPLEHELKDRIMQKNLGNQITFRASVSGEEKRRVFDDHDLLVLPSFTDISPNTALEARSVCLPVLLTAETGLPEIPDIYRKTLRTPAEIANEIRDIIQHYPSLTVDSTIRTYQKISEALFPSLTQ